MKRSKLTPCRNVGLSRRKNTPVKTIEVLLGEKTVNKEPEKLETFQRLKDFTPASKTDSNNDVPCRKVGLSRKRRSSVNNLKDDIENTQSIRNIVKKNIDESLETNRNIESIKSPVTMTNMGINKIPKRSEMNEGCVKKLSNLFSTETTSTEEYIDKDSKLFKPDELESGKNLPNLVGRRKDFNDYCYVSTNKENGDKKGVTNPCFTDSNVNTATKKCSEDIDNFDLYAKSAFIKVNYSNSKSCRDIKENVNNAHSKKSKASCGLLEDDDFEIQPKLKKSKKIIRSKTEGSEIEQNNKIKKIKKSLSVGDRSRNQEGIRTPSLEIAKSCFVKLEKMNQLNSKLAIPSVQEQSDDEFDLCTYVPKRTNNYLAILEKEISEKRKILEELQRAKIYKKIHSIEELEKLTSRWKNGCKDALQDLLKQLNMHSYMSMTMLLKKLNIPEDFVSLSQ